MAQLCATTHVAIGENMSVGHVGTYLHQSQLVTWRGVAQNCTIFGGLSIFQSFLLLIQSLILD